MKRAFVALFVIVLVYVSAYFLLMARNSGAVDGNGKIAFRSSFRWAPRSQVTGAVTDAAEVSVWNYVFYVADKVFYAVAPQHWSVNTIP
jgi:hypothetical protein